jgi:flagellar motility protein MotE (MotC chaperone)
MSGPNFAPFLRKLVIVMPAALLAAMTARPAALPNGQSPDQQSSNTQSQSIADAARRTREKAKNATKPSKIISDDDLDKENIKPGAQGLNVESPAELETQPPSPDAVTDAAATPSTPRDPATEPAASDDPEIGRLKDKIADAEKDADLARRELTLDQDTFYSNPDYEHDVAGKAKLAVLQQQINEKQQEVDRLKARLAKLEEEQKKKRTSSKPAAAPQQPADQSTNQNVPPASPKP